MHEGSFSYLVNIAASRDKGLDTRIRKIGVLEGLG